MATTDDLSNLTDFLNQNSRFNTATLFGADFFQDCNVQANVVNDVEMLGMEATDGWQPHDSNATERGVTERVWSKLMLQPKDCMRLLKINYQSYRRKHKDNYTTGRLRASANNKPYDGAYQSLVEFIFQEERRKASDELNRKFYGNEYKEITTAWNSTTAYTTGAEVVRSNSNTVRYYRAKQASTNVDPFTDTDYSHWADISGDIMYDGFGIKAKELVDNNIITPYTTGVIDETNAVDAVEGFARNIPEEYEGRGLVMNVSKTLLQNYFIKYRATFGPGVGGSMNDMVPDEITIPKSRIKLVSRTWMSKYTSAILATTPENMIVGTDLVSDLNEIRLIAEMHHFKGMQHLTLGTAFENGKDVFVNDQYRTAS